MILDLIIACVSEVVLALLLRDSLEDVGDGVADGCLGSLGLLAQEVFDLGEELLDRVQIGGI